MSTFPVAVVQFAPTADDNLPAIRPHVERAVARGARLVVFPEYSSYFEPVFAADVATHAESLDGAFVVGLTALAAEFDVTIVAGLLEATGGERVHNTVVAVDASGLVAHYRKQHLYDAFGHRESERVAPGAIETPRTFEVEGVRFGLITCYDLRFPEASRRVVDAGADAIVVPAEWVRGPLKEDHWTTLIRARAIENTVYVLAADHTPPVGVGRSMIVDPSGIVIGAAGTEPGCAIAEVSADEIDRVRAVNPALELRRYAVIARDGSSLTR